MTEHGCKDFDPRAEMLRRSIRANIADRPPDASKEDWEIDIEKPLPHWPCKKCSKETAGHGNFYGMCYECWQAQPGANRPPDAALSPVDVAFIGVEDRLRVVMDQRDALLAENKMLWDASAARDRELTCLREQVATLERHLTRAVNGKSFWRVSCLDGQSATRRASYLAAALLCALIWREVWRAAVWVWRAP